MTLSHETPAPREQLEAEFIADELLPSDTEAAQPGVDSARRLLAWAILYQANRNRLGNPTLGDVRALVSNIRYLRTILHRVAQASEQGQLGQEALVFNQLDDRNPETLAKIARIALNALDAAAELKLP